MSVLKFKHADPTRRTPTYLQAYTVENLVWQLKLTALGLALVIAKEEYDNYKWRKKMKKYDVEVYTS